jgi:nicotinate-nucleotide pyrophosphorylase (carboxylating)
MADQTARFTPVLPRPLIERAVAAALEEDLGLAGDLTTQATLSESAQAVATITSREAGIIAGIPLARAAFAYMGPTLGFEAMLDDGDPVAVGQDVVRVSGNAREIMSAERVALNFMNHLSGIATHTHAFVEEISGTNARICDTRKTTPGLRAFEKYAVRCGGGSNHRFGLNDAILIKDNHIAVAGGISPAIAAAKAFVGHLVAIEIEVDTLAQFSEALDAGAQVVLLDNMDNDTLKSAVALNKGRARLEASGGVKLDRVRSIAQTGVDFISTSQITMASKPIDLGLDIQIES